MKRGFSYILILFLLLVSCGRQSYDNTINSRVDSLYTELSAMRYSNILAFDSIATELHNIANGNNELEMVATNAMAYSAMMQMDYDHSVDLYSVVLKNSDCEIERLVADVGLMTLCYRVSANRAFFDYRSTALSRIRRIDEEFDYLSVNDKERFNRAKMEFGIVSVCYFSNLAMQNESNKVLEYIEQDMEYIKDIPLRLYAKMILCKNITDAQKLLSQLSLGINIAEKNNITWLEANYKLLLAISLRDSSMLQLFAKELPDRIISLQLQNTELQELPAILAKGAADAFECYGDEYMMIEALAVQASCNTRLERYNDALTLLSDAYNRITRYYQKESLDLSFSNIDSLLYCMDFEDLFVTNIDAGVYHVPECLLSVCRESSCAYAGLNNKELSDINREIYLNLLRTTRLNKHLESRVSIMEESIAGLRVTAIVVLILFVVLSLFLFFVHRQRMNRDRALSIQRKKLLKVSRLLLSSLPCDIEGKQQLLDAISILLNDNMCDFSGNTRFCFSETQYGGEFSYRASFDITYTNLNDSDKLYVVSEYPLDMDKESLITMLIPYIAVAVEEGMRLSDMSDEREKVEEMKRASAIYLAEHKCENILKRVSVSIVSNMRTFMDRISNELKNLTGELSAEDSKRKLQYVSELAEKLGDLNLILERWIKTRQGEVNLRIENFSVAELFAIIEKNKKMFEARGLELIIKQSSSVTKADKALTLFMINTLVDNAAKFTPIGGRVMLECIDGDGFVEISVTDTGIGMSESDVSRILEAKVYDASRIGEDNNLLKPKSKGSGFGLMNCKGIIEKYKKTDSLFTVCSFDISSNKGKGSRFSFRLPKGVLRCLLVLISFLPIQSVANNDVFERINECADSVFMSNVNGNYGESLIVAQEAFDLLNSYYRTEIGSDDTLSLYSGKAAELSWWRNSLFQDSLKEYIYYNILDIRNEVAVASLALGKWDCYNFNNNIYSTLYRLVHEDKDIANHYTTILQVSKRYEVAIAFASLLILLLLIYYMIIFVRHNIIEKTNERLVLDMNNRLLAVTAQSSRRSVKELAQNIVDELYACMGETMRIKEVTLLLNIGKEDETAITVAPSSNAHRGSDLYMRGVQESGELLVLSSGTIRIIPLFTMSNGERVSVGVLQVKTERPLSENEIISIEFVSNYLASVAYHSVARVASGYMALEELEDEAERIHYEENHLHVQNMVMDNCLSVIKHETVYYPNRIRELAEQALLAKTENKAVVADMCELMEYYSSIFGILSNCAIRELDGAGFKIKRVELSSLFYNAKQNAARLIKKSGLCVDVMCEETDAVVIADIDLVDYLFKQLFAVALNIKKNGKILLRAIDSGDFVTVEFYDNRYDLTNDEIADLFTPTKRNIESGNASVNAMEYLVAKEIIRLHEDYIGKHGGRMEARSDVSGTVILFTLPK